ncbi:Zn-dependent peptidase ImmA (M78 family) [Stackebrandtia endophytica]|uniref:Zn-dependent peptidase ImmA (M78 family) n=1 Tax=Stackebrandtia endophytica TaxID=1496996 RepID=A0A543AX76_9ACTN|nr:XRE family transcriptional regulator [Stackebrandtia endophytica]TQL77176.1 Zn-dependent peptidase ImmA (M78 family) [Stackebrandtia endophytica]
MGVDARTLGRRIAEARQRAGMTQQALGSEISLDRSALAKIEQGDRRVTALELSRIAEALGDRIEWFLSDSAPSIVSHRNMAAPGAPSPQIDEEIERRVRAVEFVKQHDGQFELPTTPVHSLPASPEAAEELAEKTRSLLGAPPGGPLTRLSERFLVTGTLSFVVDLGTDAADAASVLLDRGAVALVNGSLGVGRRRLALAHELGHILVADEYTVDWRVEMSTTTGYPEKILDRFARSLLLPSNSLARHWKEWGGGQDNSFRAAAVQIASHYRVDMATLSRRLSELGLIDQEQASLVRQFRTTKTDIVDFNLVVGDELASNRRDLPRQYEAAVIRLYRGEVISAERALDLFFGTWEATDLPRLPTSPEAAIWQFIS